MITTIAPGKMILLGEYAVLEDAPALVCAVQKRAVVSMAPKENQEFQFSAPSLGLIDLPFVLTPAGHVRFDPALPPYFLKRLHLFSKIFEYTYQKLNKVQQIGWSIHINTDDFYAKELHTKFGFGSSAALCVALVSAMNEAFNAHLSRPALFRLALNAHHYAQGKMGSGIDIAASFFGGYLIYRRIREEDPLHKLPEKIPPCRGLYFKPVFTGHSASTRVMLKGVHQLKEEKPDLYREILSRLEQISRQGSLHFKEHNALAFLQDVVQFYRAMEELGNRSNMPIISAAHRHIFDIARQEGIAYKPSGAGSGDIGILFSDDPERLERINEKIVHAGFLPLDIDVDEQGQRLRSS